MTLPDIQDVLTGALIFVRISAIVSLLPVFGDSPTPIKARVLMAMALTLGLYHIVPIGWAPTLATDFLTFCGYLLREMLIGIVIGYLAKITFDGLLLAASVVSYQMGFGTSNLFLPDSQFPMDAFTAFHRVIVMMMFLSLHLHHIFLGALADTFHLIPGGAAQVNAPLGLLIINITAGIFVVAVQLAAPIIIALLFTMAALGLVARTVPQMNVFTLSFPASFFIGLAVYIATLPFFPEWMHRHFLDSQEGLFSAIRSLTL